MESQVIASFNCNYVFQLKLQGALFIAGILTVDRKTS